MLYIGETSRQLNNRFGEHLRNVKNKIYLQQNHQDDADINISKHFNSLNHSINHMKVQALTHAPSDSRERKTLEKKIIYKLGTLNPKGLNKQFSFL